MRLSDARATRDPGEKKRIEVLTGRVASQLSQSAERAEASSLMTMDQLLALVRQDGDAEKVLLTGRQSQSYTGGPRHGSGAVDGWTGRATGLRNTSKFLRLCAFAPWELGRQEEVVEVWTDSGRRRRRLGRGLVVLASGAQWWRLAWSVGRVGRWTSDCQWSND